MTLTTGCGVKQDLDTMRDATVGMNERTKRLESLDSGTSELYDALRQGDSLASRQRQLKTLLDLKDPISRASAATIYFMSFEFQLWSGIGQDTVETRDDLAALAVKEFLSAAQEFVEYGQTFVDPLDTGSAKIGAFNSLAAVMHEVNPKQKRLLDRRPDIKEMTLLSLIQDGLRARQEILNGTKRMEDYPAYVKEVLLASRTAELLMKARYNYLGAIALGMVSEIRKEGITYLGMKFRTWTMDLEDLNPFEATLAADALNAAIEAREFLEDVGIPVELDKNLYKIFSNMTLSQNTRTRYALLIQARRENGVSGHAVDQKSEVDSRLIGLFHAFRATGDKPTQTKNR